MHQIDLFSAVNTARTQALPSAPPLVPHTDWPFPGLSPEDSTRAAIRLSSQYTELLSTIIKRHGGPIIDSHVVAALPEDWRTLLGKWAHGNLSYGEAKAHGIHVEYVAHDGDGKGGFHFRYRATTNDGEA
ncbi:hypothetical protein BOTU111921_10600 [Bordetella tumbae]|uniref:hypothetical protein n=1 Tax=Bordetella tumbae TaxID=1649139 RepID=UPI0039F0B09B